MWDILRKINPGKAPLDKPLQLFTPPIYGLNTVKRSQQLMPGELAQATNLVLDDFGYLRDRPGLIKVTADPVAASILTIAIIPIGGTITYLLVDDDGKLHKCTSSEPTLAPGVAVATLASDQVCIVPYSGQAIIMDTGYLLEYNGTTLALGRNDGDGSTGYFYDNVAEDSDGVIALNNGGVTAVCQLATTPTATGSFTFPFTRIQVMLSKTGSPTGRVYGYVYNASTGALIATNQQQALKVKAEYLATAAAEFEFFFNSDALAQNTQYRFAIGYTGGDASNHVDVHYGTVSSGGLVQTFTSPNWSATDTAKNLLISLKPNLPPKAAFGDVKESRLFIIDPTEAGILKYSNANSARDWDTTNYAGRIPIVDDNANSFEAGGVREHLKALWVIGTAEQPYLCQLIGSPGSFSLPAINLQVSTVWRSIRSAVNDLWWAGKEGVLNLQGVQSYGDVRVFAASDPIADKLAYSASTEFAEYWDGKYIVKFPNDYNLYVFHVKHPMQDPVTGRVRYPITKWTIAGGLVPTALHAYNNVLYMGCSNGHLYKFDDATYKDAATDFGPTIETAIVELPFGQTQTRCLYLDAKSSAAHNLTVTPYLNGGTAETALTIATAATVMQEPFMVRADSMKFIITVAAHTAHITFGGITIPIQKLKGKL